MAEGELFLDYSGLMGARTTSIRFVAPTLTPLALAQEYNDLITESIASVFQSQTLPVGYRWRNRGESFTQPLAVVGLWAGEAGGTIQPFEYPRFVSIQGRATTTGKRVGQTFYGTFYSLSQTYRLRFADIPTGAVWQAYIAGVQALGGFRARDYSGPASFKSYLNQGLNSYYQRKRRA